VLIVDRRPDGIAVLTLNDPKRRNAMSDEMTSAWKQSVTELRADTGHGRPARKSSGKKAAGQARQG
jgi:enoyl-CoA hydratase/carnithine racemase